MSVDTDTKFTKAMIDAMTLAEFEKLTPEQKIIIDIAQYAETEEYSKVWTAHNDGKFEGLQEGIEQGLELGRQEGREEGRAEGRAEGLYQKSIETAQNLIKMGLSDEQIAQATGLSIEQIKNLR
jgi:predicted transposase/invertase (TIGR01784 family)